MLNDKKKKEFFALVKKDFEEIKEIFSYGPAATKFHSVEELAEFLWKIFSLSECKKVNISYLPQEVSLNHNLKFGPFEVYVNGVSVWFFCKLPGYAEMMVCLSIIETDYENNGLRIKFLTV